MNRALLGRPRWPRLALVFFCLVAVVGTLIGSRGGPYRFFEELDPQNASHVCFDGRQPRLMCDFAQVYYPQGVSLRGGGEAVSGFYYSPFFGFGMRVLAELPFGYARLVWFAIVLSAVAVVVSLPALLGILDTRRALLVYALALGTSLPLLHDLLYGQVSSILLALIGGSFVAYQRQRRLPAALLLGLATAIKFYPGLFAIYYLARRDWRSTLHFAVTVLSGVVLIPWLFFGGHGYLTFVASIARNWTQLQHHLQGTPYSNAAVTVLSVAGRLWFGWGDGAHALAVAVSASVAFALLLLMVRSGRRADAVSGLLLGLALLPFVVRSCWVHYFVFLPLLQAHVLRASRASGSSPALRWSGLLGALISAALLSYPYFRLVGDADSYYRAGFPFWATLALLPALGLTQFGPRSVAFAGPGPRP